MKDNLPCLALVVERMWNIIKDKEEYKGHKYIPDFDLYMFPQSWGSTTLGFPGIGGQMMCKAYTVVVIDYKTGYSGVFFGGRIAYIIKNPNKLFQEDVLKQRMEAVIMAGKYKRSENENGNK